MQSNKVFLLLAFLLCHGASRAETNDRNQPMQIEADQVTMDQIQKTSTFTGSVQIKQGTLEIHGDKIVVSQDKQGNKFGKIYGSPASFRQKREGLNEYVEGYGERIEYDTLKQMLDMYTQARLKRAQDFIRGEHINYNVQSEIFIVDNGKPSQGAGQQRVRAVLQPHEPLPAEQK